MILDEFKNAFRRSDNTLIQLILINIVIWLGVNILNVTFTVFFNTQASTLFFYHLLHIPAHIPSLITRPWTLLTYAFMHDGIWHILFNMLFLYWFGRLIAEYLGHRRILALYILGALAGSLFYVALYNLLPIYHPYVAKSNMVGASAAVYAVVVGAATFMPNHVFHLFLLGPVRIVYIAIFYVIMSYLGLLGANAGGNIAHLGGALLGFVYIKQLRQGNDWGAPVYAVANFLVRIRGFHFGKKQNRGKVRVKQTVTVKTNNAKGAQQREGSHVPDQAEIDAILDKISVSGYESLSKEEKQKLFRASQR
ncbi:rhomboid family intramembrane serine protease [Eisenibacter elegans]|jgi:membrane associated rhomboid family serine protease|uniref:rhomboid family intramembrane serine protease n=1 Tax=Eisenibacter elegans TaxID=997 RepID=UPI000401BF23|nr:rhomboid family intramembrane serine protease [Eisenibacter elegans]